MSVSGNEILVSCIFLIGSYVGYLGLGWILLAVVKLFGLSAMELQYSLWFCGQFQFQSSQVRVNWYEKLLVEYSN